MGDQPKPHEPRKRGPSSEQGDTQPKATEVESARLLTNDAKDQLRRAGLDDNEIRRLADEFIARHLGEGTPEFVAWAQGKAQVRR